MKFKEFKEILKSDTEFNIHPKPHSIKVSDYLDGYNHRPRNLGFRSIMMALSSFVFLFALALFGYLNLHTVATVSIDINPELKVELNSYNQIIRIYANNDDAIELTDNLNLKFKRIDKAIIDIYHYESNNDQLVNDKMYLLLGIDSNNLNEETELNDLLNFDKNMIETIKLTDLNTTPEASFNITENITTIASTTASAADSNDYLHSPGYGTSSTSVLMMTTSQLRDLADEYHISITKMAVIMTIIQAANDYNDFTDIPTLVGYDLSVLFPLYNASVGQ